MPSLQREGNVFIHIFAYSHLEVPNLDVNFNVDLPGPSGLQREVYFVLICKISTIFVMKQMLS